MARPQSLNGGEKPIFARANGNLLLDIDLLNRQIETTERAVAIAMRRNLTLLRERDALQEQMYALVAAARAQNDSHERAVSGQRVPALRAYTLIDPSIAELRMQTAAGAETPTAG